VYIVGDFSFHEPAVTSAILHALNGHKILIKGNHDNSKGLLKTTGYLKTALYLEITIKPYGKIVLSHFPILSWNCMHHGAYHFHGHSHGSLRLPESLTNARIFDVGIDNLRKVFGSYAPVTIEELVEHLKDKRTVTTDGHQIRD
jgi:calcineurin-like phosphoesterase family protein